MREASTVAQRRKHRTPRATNQTSGQKHIDRRQHSLVCLHLEYCCLTRREAKRKNALSQRTVAISIISVRGMINSINTRRPLGRGTSMPEYATSCCPAEFVSCGSDAGTPPAMFQPRRNTSVGNARHAPRMSPRSLLPKLAPSHQEDCKRSSWQIRAEHQPRKLSRHRHTCHRRGNEQRTRAGNELLDCSLQVR